jgi:hypothetical protein
MRIVTKGAGGVVLIDNSYARDLAGRITAIDGVAAQDDWGYGYDDLALRHAQEPDARQ